LSTFHSRYGAFGHFAGVCVICIISIGFYLTAYRSNALTLIYTFPGIIVATAYAFFFPGWVFRYAFVASALANAIYSLVFWTIEMPAAIGTSIGIAMTSIFLLFAVAAYQKELISRHLFVNERRERESMARRSQNDSRYLAWLRQLAEFLRHELGRPLAQISTSIECVQVENDQLMGHHEDRLEGYLASALSGTRQVRNLVERASKATDFEAYVRQGQPGWIDLYTLVAEEVEAHQRSNSGHSVSLQCPVQVRVYADATLLKAAIGNLLANAGSFADEASTVEVTVDVNGSRAAIKVTNQGPQLDRDAETLFGAFASTRSDPSSDHQGLGLYLVRLIAEQHGGTAAIANLADGSGVQASILLPLQT
jgi:signal transduction histidine kinase